MFVNNSVCQYLYLEHVIFLGHQKASLLYIKDVLTVFDTELGLPLSHVQRTNRPRPCQWPGALYLVCYDGVSSTQRTEHNPSVKLGWSLRPWDPLTDTSFVLSKLHIIDWELGPRTSRQHAVVDTQSLYHNIKYLDSSLSKLILYLEYVIFVGHQKSIITVD